MSPAALSVELPVCPACSHVSKVPAGLFSGQGFCKGPKGAPHKRVRMEVRRFVEDREPATTVEAA
jgi:hypothetical protein